MNSAAWVDEPIIENGQGWNPIRWKFESLKLVAATETYDPVGIIDANLTAPRRLLVTFQPSRIAVLHFP